ncbi:MAG: UbiD family decarboxylase [Planctomycetota bacterium]|nr:UbiD family decarboxylase [Planctomycetota bacterium]MDG1983836.1 UbiD family decarboxylase [Planctomycetota bacterium]
MPHPAPIDLPAFLDRLRSEGELVEVEAEVDPKLEMAEVHRRVIAAGGPAVLFKHPRGASFPAVTNLFGTARRVQLAFGDRPEAVVERIAALPEEALPPTPGKLWAQRSLLASLAKVGLKRGRKGPVTEVIDRSPDLSSLPALTTWSRDGGPFVTLPLVLTAHPENGGLNLGMYRAQLFEDGGVGMHAQIGKGGGFHLAEAERLGRPLPVHVHVGGPPALVLAAIAPLPENVPEVLLASLVLGRRLDLCRTSDRANLPLVARSEFVLAGKISPGARRPEGPFGDHYGYYSETHDYPWFQCDTLYRRREAIWPATVVGKPRQEDFFIGDYLQELLKPLAKVAMPGVLDLWSYGETGYHALAAAVVRERYRREAMVSAFRILGEGQLSLTKFLLATDRPVELKDFASTLRHILERADFRTDLFILSNVSMDSLDYAGPKINEGSKGVLLGLGEPRRKLPDTFVGTPARPAGRVSVFTDGALCVEGPAYADAPDAAATIARDPAFEDWPLVVLVDDAEAASRSSMNFLWTTFTRFDPARDLCAKEVKLVHHHPSFTPPIVIDARMKPDYPAELFCDPETAATVDRRWSEYFPGGGVEMGDSDLGHLTR